MKNLSSFTARLFVSVISLVTLLGQATPAFAFSKDITVTNVQFSEQLDTVTVTLSRDPNEKVAVLYDLYIGNSPSTFGGGGVNIDRDSGMMTSFRSNFSFLNTETPIRLQFRVCPYDEPYTGLHEYRYCSQEFVTYVTYKPGPAASDHPATITNATVGSGNDSIAVELSAPMRSGYISFERSGSAPGYDYGSMQYRADDVTRLTLGGLQSLFRQSGTSGRQTITLHACAEQKDTTNGSVQCGPAYPLTIDLGGTTSFRDVPPSHPYAQSILYVQQQGIVAGYSDGTFLPDSPINRAEFTKIITLALFGQTMIDQCGTAYAFTDIPRDAWFMKYVCRARDGWLLTGYPDGSFRPGQSINFSEAAKILTNGYGLIRRDDHCNGKLCPDTDTPEHPWYEQYVRSLAVRHAIPTSIGAFSQLITRGEIAEIIFRLKTGNMDLPTKTYESLSR